GALRIASSATALGFVDRLYDHFKNFRSAPSDEELLRFQKEMGLSRGKVLSIARRILIDMLKPLPNESQEPERSKSSFGMWATRKSGKTGRRKASRRAGSRSKVVKRR